MRYLGTREHKPAFQSKQITPALLTPSPQLFRLGLGRCEAVPAPAGSPRSSSLFRGSSSLAALSRRTVADCKHSQRNHTSPISIMMLPNLCTNCPNLCVSIHMIKPSTGGRGFGLTQPMKHKAASIPKCVKGPKLHFFCY